MSGSRCVAAAVALALMAAAGPVPAAAEAVTRSKAISWLTELFANYYVNARCNFVRKDGEEFVSDLELLLTRAAKLSQADLAGIYQEAKQLASVGSCDDSQRARVGRAYRLYEQRYREMTDKN